MSSSGATDRSRLWTLNEVRVLAAIYFASAFALGDDGRDECRAIADALGRSPGSIDRQWRNLDAVVQARATAKIGQLVHQAARDYLANPAGSQALALDICAEQRWPLEDLVRSGEYRGDAPVRKADVIDERLVRMIEDFCDGLAFKVFRTGSQGYFRQGKLSISSGMRFQTQVSAVLIGSKGNVTVTMMAKAEDVAFALKSILHSIQPKHFRTGRRGYFAQGKATCGGERFQVQIQAVQIGES